MRKKIFVFVLLSLFLVSPVLAQTYYGLQGTAAALGYNRSTNVYGIVGQVVNAALSLAGIFFLGLMMYAGLRWMLARGKDELREKAIHALEAAVLGMIVVVLSYALSTFILSRIVGR